MAHYIRAVCLDCGDTLVDEATEVKDSVGVTQQAELIPGAAALVSSLKAHGYPLALVADGPSGTFRNVLTQHCIYHYFDAFAISAEVGAEKPDARIFYAALQQLQIAPADYGRVLMVGNYLARDVKGANALGLISVWLDWAPRRPKIPADADEVPHFTIHQPLEVLDVIAQLEREHAAH